MQFKFIYQNSNENNHNFLINLQQIFCNNISSLINIFLFCFDRYQSILIKNFSFDDDRHIVCFIGYHRVC